MAGNETASTEKMTASIYALATMDTKAEELAFVAGRIRDTGAAVVTVDVGTKTAPSIAPDVTREQVLGRTHPPLGNDRGQAVTAMGKALSRYLQGEVAAGKVAGVIGIGGSGGTALITAAMRGLPIGMPKVMVSTVASGNTAPYVDCSDITMMFSVVDVAGLNAVSETVLANAAHAVAGMVNHRRTPNATKVCLGMTMFGVTTPCVNAVRQSLEAKDFDCLVFHATGTGGRAMEGLVRAGMIQGVLDVTTTEVADEVVGGVFPCGPDRFQATIESKRPFVLSVGAVDMVNFGAVDTVPSKFRNRNLHVHNEQVTLMRTSVDENVAIARWIGGKLNQSRSPFTLLLPEGGVSMLDAPGQPFFDRDADVALFETLESVIQPRAERQLMRIPHHINDPEFAQAIVEHFTAITDQTPIA